MRRYRRACDSRSASRRRKVAKGRGKDSRQILTQTFGRDDCLSIFFAMIYGYARVSSDGQSVAAQVKELRDAGAEKVFRETASGAKTDRLQLRRALAQLDTDDVLIVTRRSAPIRPFTPIMSRRQLTPFRF